MNRRQAGAGESDACGRRGVRADEPADPVRVQPRGGGDEERGGALPGVRGADSAFACCLHGGEVRGGEREGLGGWTHVLYHIR